MYSSQNSLISILTNKEVEDETKNAYVNNFVSRYGEAETLGFLENIGADKYYYSDFTESDWRQFFSGIQSKQGSLAALESINKYYSKGILPAQYTKIAESIVRDMRK